MKDLVSYYDVLRISEKASQEEIKKSYRNLVLQFHPDRVSPEAPDLKNLAEEEFKRIQEAYDVLSEPEKRKKYDEELKNLKVGQAANQSGSDDSPVVRVDKNYFKFEYLQPNVSVSEILTVFNEGEGVLVGTVMADKPWVKLSETVISTPDYQEIEITIDAASFPPGFSDSGLIEIETNGGKETVTIDISLESSFLSLFSLYVKPIVNSFWCWALTTVLAVIFLISCLVYSCNRSAVTSLENHQKASENLKEKTAGGSSESPGEKIVINEILIREDGSSDIVPIVKDVREAARIFLGQKTGYPRREIIKDEIVDETGIFYPQKGSYYPIERARYPEFYKKCDLNRDGVVMLSELGEAQREFNRITAKYPEGDVDLIVKEFVSTRSH